MTQTFNTVVEYLSQTNSQNMSVEITYSNVYINFQLDLIMSEGIELYK